MPFLSQNRVLQVNLHQKMPFLSQNRVLQATLHQKMPFLSRNRGLNRERNGNGMEAEPGDRYGFVGKNIIFVVIQEIIFKN